MRWAAVSGSSNIVEGLERDSDKEFIRFLQIARASLAELQSQLIIARDLQYIERTIFDELAIKAVELNRILNGLMKGVTRGS